MIRDATVRIDKSKQMKALNIAQTLRKCVFVSNCFVLVESYAVRSIRVTFYCEVITTATSANCTALKHTHTHAQPLSSIPACFVIAAAHSANCATAATAAATTTAAAVR
jgi:hypothetical protein